jgi:hypothetical protein
VVRARQATTCGNGQRLVSGTVSSETIIRVRCCKDRFRPGELSAKLRFPEGAIVTGSDGHAGIYDDFPGYRLPPDHELNEALRAALVVIDANVLLNLYRYNESTRDDLLGVLQKVGDRLWVPHQVIKEFWRSRVGVLASRGSATVQALDALGKQQRASADAIRQWAKSVAAEAEFQGQLLDKIEALHAEIQDGMRAQAPASSQGVGGALADPVLDKLQDLLDGKVGRKPATAEWEAAVKEGNERAERHEPPGYLDAEKADSDLPEGAAGDYLVWVQATDEGTRRALDVLLVTGDEKEDWWWRYRSEFLGPRIELVAEYKARGDHQLYMMRPIDLLKRSSALQVSVRQESVEDVERVSRESQRSLWSAAGVAALLERLETEGREQADVIRVAAVHGGAINREDVYAICGYEDDRMLRGFTLPTTRITRELQQDGIVPEGVDPVLTTVYHGGVKAAAFRIPMEMAAILAADQAPEDAE